MGAERWRYGLQGKTGDCPINVHEKLKRATKLRIPLKPLLAIPRVSSWVIFLNRLIKKYIKLAVAIQAGGKKGKLFCNFWFEGGFCANCKCA
jgi:hypothetical protein